MNIISGLKTGEKEVNKMIINLTQHEATPDQIRAGVVDLPDDLKNPLKRLLTFDELPTKNELIARAEQIASLAELYAMDCDAFDNKGVIKAMIGGAPYLMRYLEDAMLDCGIFPVYAFSHREVIETKTEDGGVVKRTVFRHAGFIDVVDYD